MKYPAARPLALPALLALGSIAGGSTVPVYAQDASNAMVDYVPARGCERFYRRPHAFLGELSRIELPHAAATGRREKSSPAATGDQADGISDSFLLRAVEASRSLGCRPADLLAVMMRESSLRADAWNRSSNAVGLIQFLPSTLARLGWNGTPEEFRSLRAEEQLPWVERFLRPSSQYGLDTAGRVYQAVFMPSSLRIAGSGDTVLVDSHGVNGDRYQRNRGLDIDGDGRITVGELQQAVERCCTSGAWQAVAARLRDLEESGRAPGDRSELPARSSRYRDGAAIRPKTAPRTIRFPEYGQDVLLPKTTRRKTSFRDDPPLQPQESAGAIDLSTPEGLAEALTSLGCRARQLSLAAAIRIFQRECGLKVDGAAGPKTRVALAARLNAAGIPSSL